MATCIISHYLLISKELLIHRRNFNSNLLEIARGLFIEICLKISPISGTNPFTSLVANRFLRKNIQAKHARFLGRNNAEFNLKKNHISAQLLQELNTYLSYRIILSRVV